MPRIDIADLSGMTIETVSPKLTELRNAGLIEIRSIHTIILLYTPRLAHIAEGEC